MTSAPDGRAPLHVAFCINGMGVGGTEMNAFRTAVRLPASCVRLSVVCLDREGPLRREYQAAGIPVEYFTFPSFVSARAVREAFRLRRWLLENEVDIVHCHDIYSNIFSATAAFVARSPAVITSRRWGASRSRVHRWANAAVGRLAHAVIANSSRGLRHLASEGVAPEKTVLIPNFVEEEAFDDYGCGRRARVLEELKIPAEARVLGIVANLNPWKDYPTLVRAFAAVADEAPGWYLVGFGEGPERAQIEGLARTLGVAERVRLPGRVANRPNPHGLFDLSTLVSPDEGSPNSILEAMAAGRAVVATEVGGIPDLVDHGHNGLLVPPGDPEALARALLQLMRDGERRATMGEAGRRRAAERHSPDRVLGRLLELYEELVDGVRAGRHG